MDSMKDLKEWLMTKCRLSGIQNTLKPPDPNETKYVSNIVTPHSIPEFVIPGSNESSRNPSICSSDDMRSHSSGMSVTCSPSTSPAVSPRNSVTVLTVPENKSPVRVRSAPVTPRRDSHGFLRDFGVRSFSSSNSQHPGPPPSKTADQSVEQTHSTVVEGPHLRGRVNSGYSSLKENTRTQRRQSLNQRLEADNRYHRGFMRRPFRSHESLFSSDPSGAASVLPEHSCMSGTSSPRRFSPGMTDQNDYLPLRESFRRSQRYYRRRSSLAQTDMTTALWRQNSDLGFGGESPSRRIPVTTLMTPIHPSHSFKRHSAPSAAPASCEPPAGSHGNEEHEACSSGGVTSSREERGGVVVEEHNGEGGGKTVTERGDIKFSFQYFPATRRLKMLLIRAENLRFPERPDIVTNPFFKVSLMPGKVQKQTSETVKHTRNPVYNREFFFNDINMEELRNLRLRIKAFHKSQNLKLAEYLGEVNIPLVNYDLLMENRMWNDLHFKPYEQDLGHLQIELLLEPREERLTVGVIQAKGLPSHHITGSPDPYVCVSIEQHGQVITERQTRIRKKTSEPVFRECFEVRLSCDPEHLSNSTRARFCVFDHERLRSDPVLGEVWLGRGAREESVVAHWREMMHAPGRKLRRWHYILSVAETASSSSS
ncbi:uncharacterized protein LOC143282364 [Babylonia areolata]|uniref:uncharacterized protein LOC143282364 n=1 Tax=Babylonia areolata TaxID=304850 RepID=UPI003FD3DD4B